MKYGNNNNAAQSPSDQDSDEDSQFTIHSISLLPKEGLSLPDKSSLTNIEEEKKSSHEQLGKNRINRLSDSVGAAYISPFATQSSNSLQRPVQHDTTASSYASRRQQQEYITSDILYRGNTENYFKASSRSTPVTPEHLVSPIRQTASYVPFPSYSPAFQRNSTYMHLQPSKYSSYASTLPTSFARRDVQISAKPSSYWRERLGRRQLTSVLAMSSYWV